MVADSLPCRLTSKINSDMKKKISEATPTSKVTRLKKKIFSLRFNQLSFEWFIILTNEIKTFDEVIFLSLFGKGEYQFT